jgi:hypothetical protein
VQFRLKAQVHSQGTDGQGKMDGIGTPGLALQVGKRFRRQGR